MINQSCSLDRSWDQCFHMILLCLCNCKLGFFFFFGTPEVKVLCHSIMSDWKLVVAAIFADLESCQKAGVRNSYLADSPEIGTTVIPTAHGVSIERWDRVLTGYSSQTLTLTCQLWDTDCQIGLRIRLITFMCSYIFLHLMGVGRRHNFF